VAEPTVAAAYVALVRSRVASQTSYRTSFLIDAGAQMLLVVVEFGEVYVVFHQVHALGGFDFAEVSLMYGLAATAFGVADMVVGHVDRLPFYVRTGTFDAFMLRPLSALGQLVTSDFSMRRLGRVASGLVVCGLALAAADIDWTPARAALLVVTPLAGAVIFSSVFVATSTVGFWVVEGMEFANAFTYGGNYLSAFPFTVFGTVTRRFFTFVVPAAFVAYLPTLALLGRDDPNGLPSWLTWSGPLVAVLAATAGGLLWRTGVRHYTGAGS
jgi:viologen exporter family transport system permease protein